MKYLPFYLSALVILIFLFSKTYFFAYNKGKVRGKEIASLELETKYLKQSNDEVEAFKKSHRNNSKLLDSLKWEVIKQGNEAKIINRKLVKKFGL